MGNRLAAHELVLLSHQLVGIVRCRICKNTLELEAYFHKNWLNVENNFWSSSSLTIILERKDSHVVQQAEVRSIVF